MSKSGGVFQIDDVTRTMSKGGVRLVFHPSKFRPPPPGWLATGLLHAVSIETCQSRGAKMKGLILYGVFVYRRISRSVGTLLASLLYPGLSDKVDLPGRTGFVYALREGDSEKNAPTKPCSLYGRYFMLHLSLSPPPSPGPRRLPWVGYTVHIDYPRRYPPPYAILL